MARDRLVGRFGERGQAEIGQVASLELRGSIDEPLGPRIDAKIEPGPTGAKAFSAWAWSRHCR